MNAMDSCRQLPQWGCSCYQGSTDHSASSHRLSVGAEGEVPMILCPRECLRHSYRSIRPHITIREVAEGPPCREVPQM